MSEIPLSVLLALSLLHQAPAAERPREASSTPAASSAAPSGPREDSKILVEARELLSEKRFTEALARFEKALRQDPSRPETWNDIGLCRYHLDEIDRAIENFKKAASLDPGMSSAHYNLGLCYSSRKQWDLALLAFKRAVKENPKNPKAHFRLASVYFIKKDLEGAKREYEEAAALYGHETPRGEQALRNAIKMELLIKEMGK